MQAKYIKKVYISLMSIVLLMLTAVTTTFAWVGFLDNSFFDDFEINLKASELGEYGLELSLTGEEGSFTRSIENIEVKRVILKNAGYSNVDSLTDEEVEKTNFSMAQCTVKVTDKGLDDFYDISGNITKNLFKFDLFLKSSKNADIESDVTYYMDAFLNNNIFSGTSETKKLFRDFTYPTTNGDIVYPKTFGYSYQLNSLYEMSHPSFTSANLIKNPNVGGNIKVNSASACRLAIEVRRPIDLYQPNISCGVDKTIIYQTGSQYPTYNASTGEYSFGGILPDDYNMAVYDFNNKGIEGYAKKTVPQWALQRGDLEYVNDGVVNRVVDSNDSKVGINQMIRLTFYFWCEGWDADCFSIINQKPVSLNLSFSNYHY